jgi:predicted Zn finger-like uncharacterized protein
MPITTECPRCQTRARVPDSAVGRSVQCPKCNEVFIAESPGAGSGGLKVMRDLPPPPPLDVGRNTPPPPTERVDRPRPARGRVPMPTLVAFGALGAAALALVLALVALGVAVFRNPLGAGLAKYSFTTPKNALVSHLEIQASKDIRAMMELDNVREGPQVREKIRTLDVKKEAEWKGTTILFVSYERKGVKKYEVVGFEKDASTGYWLRTYFSRYDLEKDNAELGRQIRSWETKGDLNPPPPAGPGGFGLPPGGKS